MTKANIDNLSDQVGAEYESHFKPLTGQKLILETLKAIKAETPDIDLAVQYLGELSKRMEVLTYDQALLKNLEVENRCLVEERDKWQWLFITEKVQHVSTCVAQAEADSARLEADVAALVVDPPTLKDVA